jgi:hypothetical protein
MDFPHNRKYGYVWITALFFAFSLAGHWIFAWFAYVDQQIAHAQPIEISAYLVEVARDTLENWQSEFLQLIWQVAGLTYLLYVGSPQSREGDERREAKLDAILCSIDKQTGNEVIAELDQKYPKR